MNREFAEGNMVWIVLGVITLLLGAVLAFVAPNLMHYMLFTYGDSILVQTPNISNVLFAVFVVLLSLFFFMMYKESKKIKLTGAALLLISIVFLAVSMTNYTVVREAAIFHSDVLSITSEKYEWTDVEDATLLKMNDDIPYNSLVLKMNDGTELELKQGEFDFQKNKIESMLLSVGVEYQLTDR
ncbi:hypothetical protein [Jeotgalibacillus sp. R-1-5s-1]|uniref:hypothetical protein n=1 Tax=Jeotgalibacillus sp. R-1-5s-1 TaxID=2555897 RepID=UPI00106B3587|nr:hypothetical protein [Jeotgalibacillus sp. R-1-5s-1]TFD98290.1 hypothetical protein E2491_08275 [Jeotgalibacillus sp. R-1-5s-1]